MKRNRTFVRRCAVQLAAHSGRVLPESRAEWAMAIAREVDAIPSDREALRWAIGTVVASYRERVQVMKSGSVHVSRWVLTLEVLICFVPLTMLGVAVMSALLSGHMPPGNALLYLSAAAIGPIGLIAGFRVIVLRRTTLSAPAFATLCLFACWTVSAYLLSMIGGSESLSASWRELVLIALLPAAGAAHLALLGTSFGNEVAAS